MRRTLAAALAVTAMAVPASAENPVKWVLDQVDECMDCIPGRCQILNSCELVEVIGWP
jgi:hypothetical protein